VVIRPAKTRVPYFSLGGEIVKREEAEANADRIYTPRSKVTENNRSVISAIFTIFSPQPLLRCFRDFRESFRFLNHADSMRATSMDNTFISEGDLTFLSVLTLRFSSHLLFMLVKSFHLIKRILAFLGARASAGACFSYFCEITWRCHALIVIVSLKSRARETRLEHGTSSVTIIRSFSCLTW